MNNIVFVSVHPDDETLGCGGTILKHKKNGDELYWIIITSPSQNGSWSNDFMTKRQLEIERVTEEYGFEKIFKLDYETTKLDQCSKGELTKKLSDIFSAIKANIIYTPNRSDIHSDHRVAFECIYSAAKSFNHHYIKSIYMYECLSETEFAPPFSGNAFLPNYFIDISEFLEQKIRIMRIYESEVKSHPFPRSEDNIKSLALFRGAQANVKYAESFMILKKIWK